MRTKWDNILEERFGRPIGDYAGEPMIGVRDEREDLPETIEECKKCEMMPIEDQCGCGEEKCGGCGMPVSQCTCQTSQTCPVCGMMPVLSGPELSPSCGCGMYEGKRRGPTKKTSRKILRGAKSFTQKMKKVTGWADNPAAAAQWMTMKAGLKPYGR